MIYNTFLLLLLSDAEFSASVFCMLSVSGVKNLGTLKGHPDREASVVWNCHLFQSSTFEGGNLEISVFSFAEEGEHIRG